MSKHNPEKAMARAVKEIEEAIAQAKLIANMHNLEFSLSTAYGMGGTYYSPGYLASDLEHQNETGYSDYAIVNQYPYTLDAKTGGWVSSTQECN